VYGVMGVVGDFGADAFESPDFLRNMSILTAALMLNLTLTPTLIYHPCRQQLLVLAVLVS
jgi:hypothetical protein